MENRRRKERQITYTTITVTLYRGDQRKVAIDEALLFNHKADIFVLSDGPHDCAEFMCDRDVASRSVWYPTILLNASSRAGVLEYKPLGIGAGWLEHPNVIWAADDVCNYVWLRDLMFSTWEEYKYRFKRYPKIYDAVKSSFAMLHPLGLPSHQTVPTAPPQMLPEVYRAGASQGYAFANVWKNAVNAYREFYVYERADPRRGHVWTGRPTPNWFQYRTERLDTQVAASFEEPKHLDWNTIGNA